MLPSTASLDEGRGAELNSDAGARARRKRVETVLWLLLILAVFSFGVWLRLTNPPVTDRSPDEKVYMNYAHRAVLEPFTAPRELVATYHNSPGNWIYPIPLRVGYYYLIGALMELWHLTPDQAGVALSTGSSILQLALMGLFGWRFFDRWAVLVALAMLCVSPQDLAVARRVWGDGVCACGAMLLLWICAEICVRRRATPWFAALWVWSALFLLLKETGGFFFGFCIMGLMAEAWSRERSWKRPAWIAAGAFCTALWSFLVMASLCGGIPAALQIVRDNAQADATNTYAILNTVGPWYSLPLGLWMLSPLTAFGCAIGLTALILPGNSLARLLSLDRTQRKIAWGLGGVIVLVLTVATIPHALKNLRYISFITGPWYLMSGLGLSYLAARVRGMLGERAKWPLVAVAGVVIFFSCRADYLRYRDVFIRLQVSDLDVRHMVTAPFDRGL